MQRLQHPGFGKELRALICSSKEADRELAGIIVSEVEALARARSSGGMHPHEDKLTGDHVAGIRYLKLYKGKASIRVYFTVSNGALWMLALDVAKRREKLTDGATRMLRDRLKEITKGDTKK